MKKLNYITKAVQPRVGIIGADASASNVEKFWADYQYSWTNGFGEIHPTVWNVKKLLSAKKIYLPLWKKLRKDIYFLGNFIIARWWNNKNQFFSNLDSEIMQLIISLFPDMIFSRRNGDCSEIIPRFVGKNKIKVEIIHDPRDCGCNEMVEDQEW